MSVNRMLSALVLTAACALPMAYAEDPGEHQRLSDELTRRWEETAVPQFLEEKKSDIVEIMDMGLQIELSELRAILASDDEKFEGNFAGLVDGAVYSSLQHQTKMRYLIRNLQAGQLTPRSSEEHYSRFGVYLELHLHSNPKPFAWGDVELHFAPKLLDEVSDYHINPTWSYGNYNPDSASPLVNRGRVAHYLRKVLAKPDSQNEFVFHGPVLFKYLTKIVVPTGKKGHLLKEINAAKIKCPTSAGWDKLIVEQAMPVEKAG